MSERLTTWDMILPIAEFAYNNLVNKSFRLCLFEIVA